MTIIKNPKKPGTPLDAEASERGTSVYLADNRIDMVPMLLSSNLCSLRGGEERLAFSVIWEIDGTTADIVKTRFTKSGIYLTFTIIKNYKY